MSEKKKRESERGREDGDSEAERGIDFNELAPRIVGLGKPRCLGQLLAVGKVGGMKVEGWR